MKRAIQLAAVCAAVLCATSGAAHAGVITTYFDRPTFTGAVGGSLTIEDFSPTHHFPISTGVLNSSTNLPSIGITPGLIQPGVTYSTPIGSGLFFNIDAGGGYSGGFLDGFDPSDRDVTITFDSPVSAFGFDKNNLSPGGFTVTIQFSSGPSQVFANATPNSLSFFGWQSDASDITSVIVGNDNSFFGFDFDNFTFGGQSASTVPEPTSLALFGIGTCVAAVGAALRRRRERRIRAAE